MAAALMCYAAGKDRDEAVAKIAKQYPGLAASLPPLLVDDEGWTPAEIRSCCRLMRRLDMSLAETARRVGHVCTGGKGRKMLERLDAWAENDGAIDAETGELFRRDAKSGRAEVAEAAAPTKARRKVRRSSED